MRLPALITGLCLSISQPVFGQSVDIEGFANALEATYALMGYRLDLGEGELDGDRLHFDSVEITFEGVEGFVTPLIFEGVAQDATGYTADRFLLPGFSAPVFNELVIEVSDIVGSEIWLPIEAPTVEDTLLTVREIATGPLTLRDDGRAVFQIDEMFGDASFTRDPQEQLEQVDFSYRMGPMRLHLAALDDSEAKSFAKRVGRSTVEIEISMTGDWTVSDGAMRFDEFRIAGAELGQLDLPLTIGGFTLDMMGKLYAAQAESLDALESGDTRRYERIQTNLGLEMLQLSLGDASLVYEDSGLVELMLDLAAEERGLDRQSMVEIAHRELTSALSSAALGPFGEELDAALAEFLSDPGRIRIDISPREPLRIVTLAGAAVYPPGLLNLLQPTISVD